MTHPRLLLLFRAIAGYPIPEWSSCGRFLVPRTRTVTAVLCELHIVYLPR